MSKVRKIASYLSAVLGSSLAISILLLPYAATFTILWNIPPFYPMPSLPVSNPITVEIANFIYEVVISIISKMVIPTIGSAYVGTKLWITNPTTIIIALVLIVWAFYALMEVTERYQAIKQ